MRLLYIVAVQLIVVATLTSLIDARIWYSKNLNVAPNLVDTSNREELHNLVRITTHCPIKSNKLNQLTVGCATKL